MKLITKRIIFNDTIISVTYKQGAGLNCLKMSFRNLPIKQLVVFETLSHSKTFKQAADTLCMTQSGVSQHIQELENYLNKRLVNRNTKENFLTTEGIYLSKAMSRSFQDIQDAISYVKTKHGELKIKSSRSFATRWLLPRLHLFTQQHPKSNPFVGMFHTDNLDHDSLKFDILIIYNNKQLNGYEAIPLTNEYIAPVASPQICPSSLKDLASCTLLHPTADHHDWKLWANAFNANIETANSQTFETMSLAIIAATQGAGVCISDLNFVQSELRTGLLKMPFPMVYKSSNQYYLLSPKDHENQLINLFRQWVVEEIEKSQQDIENWEKWSLAPN